MSHSSDLAGYAVGSGVALRAAVVCAHDADLTTYAGDPPAVPGDRVFELASLTKVLTATILAGLVRRGTVSLETTVAEVLPAVAGNPLWHTVTLAALARHETGLPRLSRRVRRTALLHPRDPYAGYGPSDLERDMKHEPATGDGPSPYSNYGYAVLAACLAAATGSDYEHLLAEHVARPLALPSLTTLHGPLLAEAHTAKGRTVAAWTQGAYLGAGGALLDAADLLTLTVAARDACRDRPTGGPLCDLASTFAAVDGRGPLAWQRNGSGGWWHNGATNGSRSFLAVASTSTAAVGLTCNRDIGEEYQRILGGEILRAARDRR